jgi:molybdopterin/thiamine biosynthesis adenylyltransferase
MSVRESRKIFLSPNVGVFEIDRSLLLVREGEALRASKEGTNLAELRQALLCLKRGSTAADVAALIGAEGAVLLLRELAARALLLHDQEAAPADEIWTRQSGYLALHFSEPATAQKRLCSRRVAILGVGGVGGVTLQHLIAAGVSNFQLIDHDVVGPDNLNRQYLYNADAVGRCKVEAASDYATSVNPKVQVKTWNLFIESDEDLRVLDDAVPDLLILAADEPVGIAEVVNSYCVKRRIPFIGAGIGLERGFWGPLCLPDRTSCYHCFESQLSGTLSNEEIKIRDAVRSVNPFSFGPINSIISSLLARDTILFLAGADSFSSLGARITFDAKTLNSSRFTVEPCSCW